MQRHARGLRYALAEQGRRRDEPPRDRCPEHQVGPDPGRADDVPHDHAGTCSASAAWQIRDHLAAREDEARRDPVQDLGTAQQRGLRPHFGIGAGLAPHGGLHDLGRRGQRGSGVDHVMVPLAPRANGDRRGRECAREEPQPERLDAGVVWVLDADLQACATAAFPRPGGHPPRSRSPSAGSAACRPHDPRPTPSRSPRSRARLPRGCAGSYRRDSISRHAPHAVPCLIISAAKSRRIAASSSSSSTPRASTSAQSRS